jgi:CRISPR-associated endonuclease Csy4
MNYYIELKLLTDTEISLGFIWSKVYMQMHLALVERRDENNLVSIGFAFPNYHKERFLGNIVRIFAHSKEELQTLNINKWLNRLLDYIELTPIKEVPQEIKTFATFGRKRLKSNADIRRLAKRHAKRNNISEEEALTLYAKTEEKYKRLKEKNKLAFINIKSLSNDNLMKIFIIKKESTEENKGKFNTYGLSNTSTVPIF